MPREIPPSNRVTWLLGVLAALMAGGLLFCMVTRPPRDGGRPLPVFRGVKFYNGSSATRPVQVTESHKQDTTGSYTTPPAPMDPPAPDPTGVAEYVPTASLTDVTSVIVAIEIPPRPPGTTPGTITVTASLPGTAPSGSRIVEVDVILADDANPDVTAHARMLWYQTTGPYWNWTDVASAPNGISGVPCPSPQGASPPTSVVVLPFREESLYNGTSSTPALPTISYTRIGGNDPTALYTTTLFTKFDPLSLPTPTSYLNVRKVKGMHTNGSVQKTLDVLDTATDHFHVAYFIATPQTTVEGGGIVQSTDAPYWYFR